MFHKEYTLIQHTSLPESPELRIKCKAVNMYSKIHSYSTCPYAKYY